MLIESEARIAKAVSKIIKDNDYAWVKKYSNKRHLHKKEIPYRTHKWYGIYATKLGAFNVGSIMKEIGEYLQTEPIKYMTIFQDGPSAKSISVRRVC